LNISSLKLSRPKAAPICADELMLPAAAGSVERLDADLVVSLRHGDLVTAVEDVKRGIVDE
jgi:hypothetical protein